MRTQLSKVITEQIKSHGFRKRERESLKSDLSSLFPLEEKKKPHKIPNLDGIVKSGSKEWNEANLWSLSKFLFLLPTGFISIHMLPMWIWDTDWNSWTFELCMHKDSSEIKKWISIRPVPSLPLKVRNSRITF